MPPIPSPAVSPSPSDAEQITRASKSNLALAFFALPPQRKKDISVFYAFCRVIDDIADEPTDSIEARQRGLDHWKACLKAPQAPADAPPLLGAVRDLMERYQLPLAHFLEIIAGCEMDLVETPFETWEDLSRYCHRVASVVGLVSIEIFGYRDPGCRQYALDLGLALQLTNILRDVGQDFAANGRIYLPREEMERFGYPPEALAQSRHDPAFLALMNFQADRAVALYHKAQAALPRCDQRSMVAAEIMRTIYRTLLDKMRRDNFHVFGNRYRLSGLQKTLCIVRVLLSPVQR